MTAWMLHGHHGIHGGRGNGSIGICGISPQWSHLCRSGKFSLGGGCYYGGLIRYLGGGLSSRIEGLAGGDSVGLC